MRPKGSPKDLETRRFLALPLIVRGMTLTEIADLVGCHPSSVMRWRDVFRRRGRKGLEARPIPGRPRRLKSRQMRRLVAVLLRGPMTRGYSTDIWTTRRIAEVIRDEFGVSYHRDHVGRLMHEMDWSHQKPDRRALQRDEEKIARWPTSTSSRRSGCAGQREEWPSIKKGLRGWAPLQERLRDQARSADFDRARGKSHSPCISTRTQGSLHPFRTSSAAVVGRVCLTARPLEKTAPDVRK